MSDEYITNNDFKQIHYYNIYNIQKYINHKVLIMGNNMAMGF